MEYPDIIDIFPEVLDDNPGEGVRGTTYTKEFYDGAREAIRRIETVIGIKPAGHYSSVANRFLAYDRRPPAGYYVMPPTTINPQMSNYGGDSNRLYFCPIIIPAGSYDQIIWRVYSPAVGVSGKVVIYGPKPNGFPGFKLYESSPVSCDTAGTKTISFAFTALGGIYFVGLIFNGAVTFEQFLNTTLLRLLPLKNITTLTQAGVSEAASYSSVPDEITLGPDNINQISVPTIFLRAS
jgi:hypothetical protein